jgi:hypothetical protein
MFLVSLFLITAAAKVSGHWSSEAASPLAIAQQQGSAAKQDRWNSYYCFAGNDSKLNLLSFDVINIGADPRRWNGRA